MKLNFKLKFNQYLILISILFFTLRLIGLGFDQTNNDSARWFNRSENFLQAIKDGNFSETYQKYHPGVTLMIINSLLRQTFYTYQYSFMEQKIDFMSPFLFPFFNLVSKFGNIIVVYFLLLFQVYLVSKIWRKKTALVYFLFLAVEPFFIGINRWFHLTSFEVMFGFTAILLILYWFKIKKIIYLIFSAIFLGLAVLTKLTSIILLPVIFFVIFSNFKKDKSLSSLVLFSIISYGTFCILFPAMWVDPIIVISRLLDSIFHAVGEDPRRVQLGFYTNLFYYPLILLFKSSPIIIILFNFAIQNYKKIKSFELNVLFLTLISYFLFLSFSDQKIDRYSLVFFPSIILISSIFVSKLEEKYIYIYSSFSVLFAFFVFTFYSYQFSAYYNPLLGGTSSALKFGVYENGGAYFNEAAFYLNNREIKNNVLVPDNYEAFSYFYFGKSVRDKSLNYYYVVTSLDIDRLSFNNLGCGNLIQTFGPIDQKVVAIYSCK